MSLKSICGILLISRDPAKLASFYEKALAVEFEREDHDDLAPHFGIDVGQIHFAIHPAENFTAPLRQNGAILAFDVDSVETHQNAALAAGAITVQEAHDEGFGLVARFLDPEGNLFEFVQLTYQFADNK
jgi:predicted enzyme related to lactoylglutathione lyase